MKINCCALNNKSIIFMRRTTSLNKKPISHSTSGQPSGYVQVGAENWILPYKFKHHANNIYNFEARSDDVWICTYPRSGTTWTQEMIWLICNDLDYETAKRITLNERFPFFE